MRIEISTCTRAQPSNRLPEEAPMSVISEGVYDEVARIIESSSLRRQSLKLARAQFPQ